MEGGDDPLVALLLAFVASLKPQKDSLLTHKLYHTNIVQVDRGWEPGRNFSSGYLGFTLNWHSLFPI